MTFGTTYPTWLTKCDIEAWNNVCGSFLLGLHAFHDVDPSVQSSVCPSTTPLLARFEEYHQPKSSQTPYPSLSHVYKLYPTKPPSIAKILRAKRCTVFSWWLLQMFSCHQLETFSRDLSRAGPRVRWFLNFSVTGQKVKIHNSQYFESYPPETACGYTAKSSKMPIEFAVGMHLEFCLLVLHLWGDGHVTPTLQCP